MRGGDRSVSAVEARELSVRFERPGASVEALAEVRLSVPAGQTVGIVGASGAGKTTLLRALAGELPLACGSVTIDGQELTTAESGRALGMCLVPEEPPEAMQESTAQLLATAGHSANVVSPLLHALGLWERRDVSADSLAPRHRRALALARALLARPRLLLLDEPGIGDNPTVDCHIGRLLDAASREGRTTLLATSRLDLALQLCERLIVLREGRVVADLSSGTVQRLVKRQAYAIRVLGHLGTGWEEWFDGLEATAEPGGTTLLVGSFPDQVALHGLLARIGHLGLTLIGVHSVALDLAAVSLTLAR
jgi:ABC-type multidrug transport system ATPase subunit